MCDGSPARICRSVSADGYHFEKDRGFSFVLSEKYQGRGARDPKMFRDADGLYHMILTTSLRKERVGCLAHLVSEDLTAWHELDEPIYVAPDGRGEPECPDYFYKDGFYYLVYSLRGTGYYQYSRQPFTGWQTPENPEIPCKSVPKAAVWRNRLIFTGFEKKGDGYAGTMTFMEAAVQEDGCLQFKECAP
jgi:sucrose-6-phosphate hydrolase SacC (GH32 family)